MLASKRFTFREWQPEALHEYATAQVRREVSQNVSFPSFEQYVDATQVGARCRASPSVRIALE